MKTAACCRRASRWRRGGEVAGWVIPGAVLVLLPKCPACVAAYVMLVSGIGISLASAATLRTAIVLLCVGWLIAQGVRWARPALAKGFKPNS